MWKNIHETLCLKSCQGHLWRKGWIHMKPCKVVHGVRDFQGHLAPLLYWMEHGGGEDLVPKHSGTGRGENKASLCRVRTPADLLLPSRVCVLFSTMSQ